MKSAEIRSRFLDFFKERGHSIVASSSLVPGNDPTLLFTNSGMVQFKDVFLGKEARAYTRATSSQRSVRAGGKHNDLENVGYTARHHTFFEMLGNFSFGDYFKRDAIKYAWELLTSVYGLDKERLWVTVYQEDDEAYAIWEKEVGVPAARIVRIGDNKGARYASDNFWQMADTGPCGPCTEIFYDHGPEVAGGPPGSPEQDGDRYIEIWNLVFMQYDRDASGKLNRLPKPCVDTGMGLERIAAVLQHVHSNYEIDLFQDLIRAAARETGTKDLANNSLKVIADHIRACSFLVVDGVIPGNEGRGYVLRRIIRRAIRHGWMLGQKKPFFHRIVADLVAAMGAAYPELAKAEDSVTEVLRMEEERFAETIESGMRLLERGLLGESRVISYLRKKYKATEVGFEGSVTKSETNASMRYDAMLTLPNGDEIVVEFVRPAGKDISTFAPKLARLGHSIREFGLDGFVVVVFTEYEADIREVLELSLALEGLKPELLFVSNAQLAGYKFLDGGIAFTLYDTFGFPLDLTADICRERGLEVDVASFESAMERQREQARSASKFRMAAGVEYKGAKTEFKGYDLLALDGAKVTALYRDGSAVDRIAAGEAAIVVLERTPFYAESGGQAGDAGELHAAGAVFAVSDTQKIQADVFGHHGTLASGSLAVGDTVKAAVDTQRRARTMRNHSATHLMHKALREVLGAHVQQKGSLVDADKTRFDFAHNAPVTDDEIRRVEALVNAEVTANAATRAQVMAFDDAVKGGAMALFGEKYGDTVRVLDIGSSRELCGGTHVARTGDIGFFKIVAESGVAAGIRRVEAVTGDGALAWVQQQDARVTEVAHALRAQPSELPQKVAQVLDTVRGLEKELARLKSKLASSQGDDLASQAEDVKGVKLLAAALEGADAKALRETLDKLKDKLKSAVLVLAAADGQKVSLIAGVTADLTSKVKAGELVNMVALQVGGKGGGRPDMAQAGGTDAAKLPAALASVRAWVEAKL